MTGNGSLSGVAGWLRFFIIIVFISGCAHVLISVGGFEWKELEKQNPELIYHSGFQHLQLADRLVGVLGGAAWLYAGFLLLKRKVIGTIKSVKLIIGVIFPLLVLVRYIASPYLFLGVPPNDILASDPSIPKDIARTFIWAAIWVSYLHRSERVKNTYQ